MLPSDLQTIWNTNVCPSSALDDDKEGRYKAEYTYTARMWAGMLATVCLSLSLCVVVCDVSFAFLSKPACAFSKTPTASSWWRYRALPHADVHAELIVNQCFTSEQMRYPLNSTNSGSVGSMALRLSSCPHNPSIRHVWTLRTFRTLLLIRTSRPMCDKRHHEKTHLCLFFSGPSRLCSRRHLIHSSDSVLWL